MGVGSNIQDQARQKFLIGVGVLKEARMVPFNMDPIELDKIQDDPGKSSVEKIQEVVTSFTRCMPALKSPAGDSSVAVGSRRTQRSPPYVLSDDYCSWTSCSRRTRRAVPICGGKDVGISDGPDAKGRGRIETYTLSIWDERGPGATVAGGRFSPYSGSQFALYRPQQYTPLSGETQFCLFPSHRDRR
jgi:hypothetical protein